VTLLSVGWWANLAYHGSNPDEPGQKSTRIEICKKISIQPGPNSWWARLAREFQPILTTLPLYDFGVSIPFYSKSRSSYNDISSFLFLIVFMFINYLT